MSRKESERYGIDPQDGHRVENVGDWSEEKHLRLRRYVDITRATRRKYDQSGASYIDLYCGPGRARVRDDGRVIDGSAIVAAQEAAKGVPFTQYHIGDLEPENVAACAFRMQALIGRPPQTYEGPAQETAAQVASALNPRGLHLAFLDPYSIGALPFSVIRNLARLEKMDLIIHISVMDLQRNVKAMLASGALGSFAPGCVEAMDVRQRNDLLVRDVFRHWRGLVEQLNYKVSDNIEHVRGERNQPLYWLVLASRHDLGRKFWEEVSNVEPQRRLF